MVTDDPSRLEPTGAEGAARRQRLGPYVIDRRLGSRELESVFLAHDPRHGDREVVLRVPEVDLDEVLVARLEARAERLRGVGHPHLVPVIDFVRDDAAFVTEHVEGTRLAELIAEFGEGLEADRVIRWAEQIGGAVDALHESDLVHGDVTCSNILIDDGDDAHLDGVCLGAELRTLRVQPTERDLLLATAPSNASPHDVRDLAAAVYEALGGGAPPAGGIEPPPVRGATVAVNLALLAALGPDDAARPRSAAGLVAALRGEAAPTRAAGVKVRLPRATLPLAAAAMALAVTALGAWLWLRPGKLAPTATLETFEHRPLAGEDTLAAGHEPQTPALSPQPPAINEPPDPGPPSEAEAAVESASESWRRLNAEAPETWLEVDAVQEACLEAQGLAEQAEAARAAGRLDVARALYGAATDQLWEAIALHHDGVEQLWMESQRDRREGRFANALRLIDELAVFHDAQELRGLRVETYLALARARNARATRDEAREAVDELLALDPGHPEGLALAAQVDGYSSSQRGDVMVNSLSQTLVLIEPGEFHMGSPPGEPFHQRTERRHPVRLTRGFWMGRVEVTRGQFQKFVRETSYVTDAEIEGWTLGLGSDGRWHRFDEVDWRDPSFGQTGNHPVVCVSWRDAEAFCQWLSERENLTYRLPTEAEWEYACRAGSESVFAWGEDEASPRTNAADEAWMSRFPDTVGFDWFDEYTFTAPVASFPANAWGLFDMHGNAQEWCADVYAPYPDGEVVDPTGPAPAANESPRVLRGGSFAAPPARCRAAHRDASRPSASFVTTGFRIILEDS